MDNRKPFYAIAPHGFDYVCPDRDVSEQEVHWRRKEL